MKKKLLITLGCSFTEGVGAWDPNIEQPNLDGGILPQEIYQKHRENFHKESWPVKLQKHLNYHRCINLGLGGSSTSGQLKRFMEILDDYKKLKDEYEILIVWMITAPFRISFYKGNRVIDLITGHHRGGPNKSNFNLFNEYISFLEKPDEDLLLEQLFYIKVMREICIANGFHLLHTGINLLNVLTLKNIYPEMPLLDTLTDFIVPNLGENLRFKSKYCYHPNELGYEVIAKNIYTKIDKEYPHLVNHTQVDNLEWSWDGQGKYFDFSNFKIPKIVFPTPPH
jgi:hypothetical protein